MTMKTLFCVPLILVSFLGVGEAKPSNEQRALDARVEAFLESQRGKWRDLNVPASDGKALHDLIVNNGYKNVLDIGTSTGHSAIWMAWAVSKTGGKVTTIELDPERHAEAKRNFQKAGLTGHIDAHLGDAHAFVPKQRGPFDLVFCDADKDWYTQYFEDTAAKIRVGGAFAAHNIYDGFAGVERFLAHVGKRKDFTTTQRKTSRSGMSVSRRTR